METSQSPHTIRKGDFQLMVSRWMDYAKTNLTSVYMKRADLDGIIKRIIAAGYADEQSIGEGEPILRSYVERIVLDEQREMSELNKKRLLTLASLTGKKPADLAGTTVVSIGGGPGDEICEPWFPRLAAVTGANVINFDYSPAHPIDQELGIYRHIGGSAGDVFHLLLNETTINNALKSEKNISIIECNNLIGNNISPSLGIALGELGNPQNHPKIVQMRNNLREAAQNLLMEGGVLAIDNAYWVKRNGALVPVDEKGEERHNPIFSEERISNSIPEPLSGLETAELVAQLYDIAGERIGSMLVESNIVLTLAGARGQTEFFIQNPQKEDWEKIAILNKSLEARGISIIAQEKAFPAAYDGSETLMVSIENLRGYERVSKLTKIPSVRQFDSSTGWKGLNEWKFDTFYSLEEAQIKGDLNCDPEDVDHVFTGILKGYPDQAIFDVIEWGHQDRKSPIADSNIPHVSLYGGAEPNFFYHSDHAKEPTI